MARKTRRDAAANRERLIEAAFHLLAERDADLSVRELAMHTGHGVGTAYRHFPSHADLIRTLYDTAWERITASVADLPPSTTAWGHLVGLLDKTTMTLADFPAVRAVMRRMYDIDPDYAPAAGMAATLQSLIDAAVAEGAMRPGITGGDLALTAFALGGMVGNPSAPEREMLRRHLVVFLDGLRADGHATDLPATTMSPRQFHTFVHRSNAPAKPAHHP